MDFSRRSPFRSQKLSPQLYRAVTYGVTREQMMASHKSNHIQCVYAKDAKSADEAMLAKAAMAEAMGMEVAICGTKKDGKAW